MTRDYETKLPTPDTSQKHGSNPLALRQNSGRKSKISCDKQKTQRVRLLKDNGNQRIQICFRLSEKAFERLSEIARLFEMRDSEYAKAVLYKDLGMWNQPIDRRRKSWRHKQGGYCEDESH